MVYDEIDALVRYGTEKGLIGEADGIWARNRMLDALGLDGSHRLVIVLMQLVNLLQDGQPVRLIDLDTGAILIEYEYSSDGRWIGVKEGHGEEPPVKILNIKLDKNGNIVEYSAEQGYEWSYGAGARWEWIFVPAQEQ